MHGMSIRQTTQEDTARKHEEEIQQERNSLKTERLFPGDLVSVDHFIYSEKGRLIHTYGKEAPDEKFSGGCIFVDHASGYIHVELQQAVNSHQTLQAKDSFEAFCSEFGVIVKDYLTDNGSAFRSTEFEEKLKEFHQHI